MIMIKNMQNETKEIHSMVIVVSAVFHENNKYHS